MTDFFNRSHQRLQMETHVKLSPAWYTFWNKVNQTLGADPAVSVGQLQTNNQPYIIPITVNNAPKAQALANIVVPYIQLGGIKIDIQISISGGEPFVPQTPSTAQELYEMTQTALTGNTLLNSIQLAPLFPNAPDVVWPIFSKSVIQFGNDDLSDYFHNFNGVTASVFKTVLNLTPGGFMLYPTTSIE